MAKLNSLRLERDAESRLHLTFTVDGEAHTIVLRRGDYAYTWRPDGSFELSFNLTPPGDAEVFQARARANVPDEDDRLIYVDGMVEPLLTRRQFRAMLDLARDDEPSHR